jgi:hypothetical protein
VIRAHQPGSEPIDIPETIPNPVVVPRPTPTPTEPAPKEPVRNPERVPGTARVARSAGQSGQSDRGGRGTSRGGVRQELAAGMNLLFLLFWFRHRLRLLRFDWSLSGEPADVFFSSVTYSPACYVSSSLATQAPSIFLKSCKADRWPHARSVISGLLSRDVQLSPI